MKVFKTDIATYSVYYKKGNKPVKHAFKSFAAAAGCAEALEGLVRLINVDFCSPSGDSAISGTLYIYSPDNSRRVGSPHLVKAATERKGY